MCPSRYELARHWSLSSTAAPKRPAATIGAPGGQTRLRSSVSRSSFLSSSGPTTRTSASTGSRPRTSRGRGEALSLRRMVAAMYERHGTDPNRVFVTGPSAGGAMTAVMLATYPEVFAGGAIIAGLPYGTARSVPQAFDRMRGHGGASPDALAAIVRSASHHKDPWRTLSVWHGTRDATVDFSNARAIVDQWSALHGLPRDRSRTDTVDGYPRKVWEDAQGNEIIEQYVITDMGHGTPLSAGAGFEETPGPFMLDVGISSTRRITSFWGIDEVQPHRGKALVASEEADRRQPLQGILQPKPTSLSGTHVGVQKTIEDALRAAGLMR